MPQNPKPRTHRIAAAEFHRKTRRDNAQETAEDYAEAISDLIAAKGSARSIDLAAHFGISPATVAKTLVRLKRDGLVTSEPYRPIFLTPAGSALADASRARHRLVTDFLRHLGVPAHIAEADAEGIEHHASAETLAAFRRLLASKH